MFWNKKKKPFKKSLSSKEGAMMVKSAANSLLQDFNKTINPIEIVVLNSLVSFMDTFILKCFKDDKLVNTLWITARLVEVKIVLGVSSNSEVKRIVRMVECLEELINSEKVKNG